MRTIALNYLQTALNKQDADFKDGQWESIECLLDHKRMLVVQRTGWGKSMVYFLATKLIRKSGLGPTLLISPLLSLMRNQLEAANRIGITARTINSTNTDEWNQIQNELASDSVDVLLISPERLANDSFRQGVLSVIAERIGLFVIDEAHCISDWGHDFRPDYRRIVRVLQAIPPNVAVLATTATANNRVVDDVMLQLGNDIELIRGSLLRESLKLQNINMPSPAARMAWLAQTIPNLLGSGIIYTLTQCDAERLTEWLRINEINAKSYHAGIPNHEDMFKYHQFEKRNIPTELQASEGRALSLWRDAGWGQLVVSGKYQSNRFADELVTACVEMIAVWNPTPKPKWLTCIPSLNHPELVPDFAQRLAIALKLPFIPCIEKVRQNNQQKTMENSFQQAQNLDGVFKISFDHKEHSPCLLIDDMVDSRWTFTVASALLRETGCTAVYPLALALNSPRMD